MTTEVTTLENGLRVATNAMETVESVSLGVWVGVGTRSETPEINGVAHMLEHMAFKGTKKRSARCIAEEIEAVGGHLNAYTSRECTVYHAKVLKDDVPLALDILSDILQHSLFDETELERERSVIIQEIGQSLDTPEDVIFDHFQARAFPEQAIGRPILGTTEMVGGLTREAVGAYLRENYTASRMVVAAAGRVEHARFADLVAAAFDSLPGEAGAPPEAARYRGGEIQDDRNLEQVHLVLGFEGFAFDDPDYDALTLLSNVLGGGMSSRLFQEVREKRALAYNVYSFMASYMDGGLFGVYAGTGEDQVRELVPVICDEIAGLGGTIGEEELNRAKAQMKAGLLMALESTGARCEQLGQHLLVYGRPIPVEELTGRIDAVDGAAIGRVVARLLDSPPTFAALGPLSGTVGLDDLFLRLRRA